MLRKVAWSVHRVPMQVVRAGLFTAPSGRSYAIAVMIARTREPTPVRMEMMQQVVRAVARYEAMRAPVPASRPNAAID